MALVLVHLQKKKNPFTEYYLQRSTKILSWLQGAGII